MKKLSAIIFTTFALWMLMLLNLSGQITFEDGFESGNYNKWKEHIEGSGSKIEICDTRARSGNYSVRCVTNNSRRAELVGQPNIEFFWGIEYWIGFSFYTKVPAGGAKIIYQHHSTPGNRNWDCAANPNSFTIKSSGADNIRFNTSTLEYRLNAVPTEGGATKYTEETYYPHSINTWHDVVMNFKYNPDSTGFIKVWLNGELVLDHKGINVYLKDGCGELRDPRQYMKIGVYPAGSGADGEIYYDEIRIGDSTASYEDVKPRGEIKEYRVHDGDGIIDENIKSGNIVYSVDWAFKEDFKDSVFENYWLAETSGATINETDSTLIINDSVTSEGVTLWIKDDFAFDDVIIKARAKSLSGAANLNLMTHTRESDGTELQLGLRNGNYEDYHYGIGEKNSTTPPTQGYIATFTSVHSRFRKNPGFQLLAENMDMHGDTAEWYNIKLIINQGKICYFVNDSLIYEANDPQPLTNGKTGIRSWHTLSAWDYFYVGEILRETEDKPAGNGGLPVTNIHASSDDGNLPQNTCDNNLMTRWSAEGDGQWIIHELDSIYLIGSVDIAFHKGSDRITYFEISCSEDGTVWEGVYNGSSSGTTDNFENFRFNTITAKYVRLTGHKNSVNEWNSITEIRINAGEMVNSFNSIDNDQLHIYPNPLKDILYYKLISSDNKPYTLIISSMEGKTVLKEKITDYCKSGIIHLQSLQAGFYIVELKNNTNNCRKIMCKL